MADQKLTGLTAITLASGDDLIYTVDDPAGTPLSRKITKADFMKFADGAILYDDSGNELLEGAKTATAVNHVKITNQATGADPLISAVGGDTDIDLELQGKGTGRVLASNMKIVTVYDSNNNELLKFTTTASAVNELELANAATGTAVELRASGGDANVDVKLVPKGSGVFFGSRESWGWPMGNEDSELAIGVVYTTEPAPYNMKINDVIAGLTTAGTGVALFTFDVLKEDSVNANTFTTIFTTKPTIDASEFTSTTAATPMSLSVTTWEKGRRLQLKIDTLDTDGVARGPKIELVCHATAK